MRTRVAPVLTVAGGCTALLGLGVAAGWALGIERITSVVPGLDPMTFNSAIAFAILGVALLALARRRQGVALGAATVVAAYGVVTFAQHLFNQSLFDALLLATPGTATVVRGSLNSALAFLLLAVAVLILAASQRFPGQLSAAMLGTSAVVIALVDLLGYLLPLGGGPLGGVLIPQMALHTTVGVLIAGSALLYAGWWSERGIAERPATRVGFWIATVVFIASVFLAQVLRANERGQIRSMAQVAVQGVADQLQRMLLGHVTSARALAATLARVPRGEQEVLAQEWPGERERAIGVIAPGRPPRWLVLRDSALGPLARRWLDSAAAVPGAADWIPTLLQTGNQLWLGILADTPQGAGGLRVWVVSDLEHAVRDILSTVSGRFGVVVRTEGRELARQGLGNPRSEKVWGVATVVPFGPWRWEIAAWPDPATLAAARSVLPAVTLAAGTLVGVLLGLAFALARHARLQTFELQRVNDRLTGEIGEREAAEAALRQREDELRQAQKLEAVGRLAGGIAHDYNNILTVIRGNARSLIARETDASLTRDALEHIDRAAARGSLLTARLLAFSQRQLLQPETFSLGDLVTSLHDELSHLLGPHVRLLIERTPGVDLVHLDRRWITQVILDLALNGREAMPFGGTLWLKTRVADDAFRARYGVTQVAGSLIALEIADSGRGMDESTRERLFEPFFSTKPFGQGSGLALASAYGIVRQSGGEIAVLSEPGRGTRVALFLPLVDGPAPAASPPDLAGRTVLVAEDEPGVLRFIRRTLEGAGCVVIGGASAEAALDALAASGAEPDLLVSDIVMPGISGVELAERLRQQRPGLAVLFVSAYTTDALKQRGIAALAAYLLQKPFTAPELLEQAGRALQVSVARPEAGPN